MLLLRDYFIRQTHILPSVKFQYLYATASAFSITIRLFSQPVQPVLDISQVLPSQQ